MEERKGDQSIERHLQKNTATPFLANAMEFINLKICHTTSLMLEDKILIYYSETEIFMDMPFG